MRFLHGVLILFVSCGCVHTTPKETVAQLELPVNSGVAMLTLGDIDDETVPPLVAQIRASNRIADIKIIMIEIDSDGGIVSSGQTLSKAIERSAKPVVCVVDGTAASMALYVLESCDVRVVTARSMLMGHAPAYIGRISAQPNKLDAETVALKLLERSMAIHITAKAELTVDEYLAKTNGRDWWFGPDEALTDGLVDYVVPDYDTAVMATIGMAKS